MKNNERYNEAVKHFNRVGGQLKRYHNIDPAEYLNNETKTEKGVKRALDKMRLDAELDDVTAEVDDLSDDAEEIAKENDFQDKADQYKQARETLSDKWGVDMDSDESEIFWRAFDDPDILDAFGSTNVLYMEDDVRNDEDKLVTTRQAAQIAKGTAARAVGSGKTAEQIRDLYNTNYNKYKQARKDGLSHNEAIEDVFND